MLRRTVVSFTVLALALWSGKGRAEVPAFEPLPFSLTISGGISLGSYEAGINWALVEYLKQRSPQGSDLPQNLLAVTGASAGSINAVMTAMNWCSDPSLSVSLYEKPRPGQTNGAEPVEIHQDIDRNLIRDVWVDVGIDDLLPKSYEHYVTPGKDLPTNALVDGVFTRAAFATSVRNIEKMLDQQVFVPGCKVPVAMLTTREVPAQLSVGKVKVNNQRFVFSLQFVADEQGKGHFENFNVEDLDGDLGNVVYLPTKHPGTAQLAFEDLKRVIFASSAFPVAFAKVRIDYCSDSERGLTSERCAAGMYLNNADFVDGGVFDNIPLGTAEVVLTENEQQIRKTFPQPGWGEKRFFFFISPDIRRNVSEQNPYPVVRRWPTYGLSSLLDYISGAMTTSSEYELYTVLKKKGTWSDDLSSPSPTKKIVPTSRYFPITGAYLGHFGAFLDRPFREFDYYTGIYDAAVNLAEIACTSGEGTEKERQLCIGDAAREIHAALGVASSRKANAVFSVLASLEHPEYRDPRSSWGWISDELPDASGARDPVEVVMHSLHAASGNLSENDDEKFRSFVRALKDNHYQGGSWLTKRILDRSDEDMLSWYAPVVDRVGKRLQKLQYDECQTLDDNGFCLGVALGSLGAGKYFAYDSLATVGPSTEAESDIWYKLIPYEVNTDTISGGFSFAYIPQLRKGAYSLDLKLTPVGYNRFGSDWIWFSQIDLYPSWHSSWNHAFGVGPTLNFAWERADTYDQVNLGMAAYWEYARTLRVTGGVRSFRDTHHSRNNFYVTLGLVDLPGMVSRLVHIKLP